MASRHRGPAYAPPPESRRRRVPNRPAPWPGAARAPEPAAGECSPPQGLRPDPASSPCPRAPGRGPRHRGVTQRGEGGDSLGLEIRSVQGLECRDEWGERESSELVPGQGWGVGPGWDRGKKVRHKDHRRSHGCTALCGPEPWWGGGS